MPNCADTARVANVSKTSRRKLWGNKIMKIYCPVCQRDIEAPNIDDVESGISDGYVYVHDDIPHEDDDIEALSSGLQ